MNKSPWCYRSSTEARNRSEKAPVACNV
jgi:hypothetical protein